MISSRYTTCTTDYKWKSKNIYAEISNCQEIIIGKNKINQENVKSQKDFVNMFCMVICLLKATAN